MCLGMLQVALELYRRQTQRPPPLHHGEKPLEEGAVAGAPPADPPSRPPRPVPLLLEGLALGGERSRHLVEHVADEPVGLADGVLRLVDEPDM